MTFQLFGFVFADLVVASARMGAEKTHLQLKQSDFAPVINIPVRTSAV